MKRLLPALFALVLLSGCGSRSEPAMVSPTAEEVAVQYSKAATLYDWFDKISPPCTGDSVEVDGNCYRQVDVEGLLTYADLEAEVRAVFSPELSDRLLSESQNFRDIDGKLYCAEGGRGDNIYLYDKTVHVNQLTEDHFTVELTFWSNFSETVETVPPGMDTPYPARQSTFGCSAETLNYEQTEEGYRFTNFCSSDALDLDAETVYTFNYTTDFETGAWEDFGDWQLICYLCNADGAAADAPNDTLMHRFLQRPQELLSQLALLYESPFYGNPEFAHIDSVVLSPAYTAAAFLYADEYPDMTEALDACKPETHAQQELLNLLKREFEALTKDQTAHDPQHEFSLLLPGKPLVLTLGEQAGAFPWEFDLTGTVVDTGPADTFGTAYTVDCNGLKLQYCVKNGIETLYAMSTDMPYETSGGLYCTPRGLYCGMAEEIIPNVYLHAVKLPDFEDPSYDSCYVYEILTQHISFYCKDGVIARIDIVNLVDDQVLD